MKMSDSILTTKRTYLRLINATHLDSIHQLLSFPEIDKYNTLGIPKDMEETKTIVNPMIADNLADEITNYTLVIENKENNMFIGLLGLKLWGKKHRRGEVWYKILPVHWNLGYATEALSAILVHGFDTLKLHRIQAGCAVNNIASIRVLDKVGMIREGRSRQTLPLKTGWSDNFEYAILDTDQRTSAAVVS
jgi:ribosomal-protein-alanine N-acetyltransferase